MSDGKFDSHRRLCPDGACIGVIGDDGRCRVCGRSAGGGANAEAPAGFVPTGGENGQHGDDAEDDDDTALEANTDEHLPADGDARSAASAEAGFDANRRLCPDGGCIGVVGADGICTVCGQKAD
jgi:hypothetical protein